MTDRELLELSARAAGHSELIYCEFWKCMARWVEEDGGYFDSNSYWNPLTSDGDALRLAVSLHFTIKVFAARIYEGGFDCPGFVEIWADDSDDLITTEYVTGGDYDSTTRRAIVRAAAEIGKVIQQPKLEDVPEDNYYKAQAEAENYSRDL